MDKNKIYRALLIWFFGWIGSAVINRTALKPDGWTSRSWLIALIPFYRPIASIAAFFFDDSKDSNLGYTKD